DLVEINCHGSIYIQKKIIEIIINKGARLAKNGEFTYRAYINKKKTLIQAESVLDIIKSENKFDHKIAINNLINNKLYKKIENIKNKILNILSYIEINLDFIEEQIKINKKKIYREILYVEKKLLNFIKLFKINQLIKKGIYITLIGPVNSGKSTLMNVLIKEKKAIISNIPGTTRDVIEGKIKIKNFNFYLFDTAGIRKTKLKIEKIGIKKTFKKVEETNIIFFIFNYILLNKKKKLKNYIKKNIEKDFFKKQIFFFANKIDKKKKQYKKLKTLKYIKIYNKKYKIIFISAQKHIGLKKIKNILIKMIPNKEIKNNNFINNIRHYYEIKKTLNYIIKVKKDFLKKISLEFISIDLKNSIKYLYNINGKYFNNDYILNNIFSKFCIGK
ncbi:MAG: tRNA uridine-5-carboxymethylaminomethyl(34) synthesis GTPase MnmE, partial [Candidatus Shikimatogenerans sp. JK-2022]|nr:tRNA uridine-5-carboxymethylaminomethyl(34) synthesis GTPase MnmE [Candidatus Shikimatogenerans bostrichidophilus]